MVRKLRRKKAVRRRKRKPVRFGKPVIGITCEVHKLKPYFAEFELVCDYRYIRAVIRAGGNPVVLPINPLKRDSHALLDQIDGLLIVGGADIHPTFYGEKSKKKLELMYRGRTYFEMRAFRAAQKRKIPILAICYGMQLVNTIYGGKLHQDIQSELRHAKDHRNKRNPFHHVTLMPGSLFHKIFGKKTVVSHCEHHQAVKMPGRGMDVTAFSEDGIAEAIEGPARLLAVQWHPERQPKDPVQRKLFSYFMKQVRAARLERLKG